MRILSSTNNFDTPKSKVENEQLPEKKEMPVENSFKKPVKQPIASNPAAKNDVSSLEKKGLKRLPKPNFSEAEVWDKIKEFEAEKGGASSLLKGPAANTKGKLKDILQKGAIHFSEKERETFSQILKN